MWNTFEQDKEFLKNQYKEPKWCEGSGIPVFELRERCNGLLAEMSDCEKPIVKAKLMEYIFCNGEISVNPRDMFQAQINHGSIVTDIRKKWIADAQKNNPELNEAVRRNEAAYETRAYSGLYDFSHISPDWEMITELGIPGIISEIEREMSKDGLSDKQNTFYQSCLITYKAFLKYVERLASETKKYADENKSEKMRLVSASLSNITKAAPSNILEAMQLVYIFYYVQTWVEGENVRSLGNIDKLFIGFYENDIKSGTFTQENIREIIDYFYYEFYAVGAIANSPFCLCGQNEAGDTYINKLSYILIEEYIKCDVDDPKIHIRYKKDLPEDFVKLVLKSIIGGNNSILFMNDDVVVKGLEKLGVPRSDAVNYAPIGCYEPAVIGKEAPCSCAGRVNLAKAVELVMNNGYDIITSEKIIELSAENTVENIKTYEDFVKAVKDVIKLFIDETAELINAYERCYMQMNPSPLLSGAMRKCLADGRDLYDGGAEYNNTSIAVFGIADFVDSAMVVKNLVFEDGAISYRDFCNIVKNNWKDNELLILKCKNSYPKYGNNNSEADALMTEIVEYAASLINNRKNARGGVYRCGLFSIDWYQYFGERTGATPNGRLNHDWLSKNLNSTIGNDKKGLTALINSVTKLDHTDIPNGVVLDLIIHSSAVKEPDGADILYAIFKTYFERGGMAIQFNILNYDCLKDAQKNPEKYPNLQVRLCGWNVYFVNLSEGEQNEFIKMTAHSIEA